MLSAIRTTYSSIGLVYDANEFRAAQLVRDRSGERVMASAIFPRYAEASKNEEPDIEEFQWARSMLARRGFVGDAVSVLPSTAWCSSQVCELPPVEDPDAKIQLARAEVVREKKCAPTDFEVGYWDLPAKGRTRESMVTACQRSALNAMLDQMEDSGMEPLAVDLPELALVRTLPEQQNNNAIVGILHIGWEESLAVIKSEGVVVYVRRVEHGIKALHDRLCAQYPLDDQVAVHLIERMVRGTLEEHERPVRGMWTTLMRALVDEFDVAIRYVSHVYRTAELGSVFVSGYGATHSELLKEIDTVLGMSVEPLISDLLKDSEMGDDQCAKLALAVGLASRFDQ